MSRNIYKFSKQTSRMSYDAFADLKLALEDAPLKSVFLKMLPNGTKRTIVLKIKAGKLVRGKGTTADGGELRRWRDYGARACSDVARCN